MSSRWNKRILIVDDDPSILAALNLLLEPIYGDVICSSLPASVIELLENGDFELLIMDLNYSRGMVSGEEGLKLLERVKNANPELSVMVMTAFGELDLVVKSMQLGASDFIQKPWTNDRILVSIANVLKLREKDDELKKLKANSTYFDGKSGEDGFGMIGNSNALNLLRDKIQKVASSHANVLILGENGTGKELAARAIHSQSNRKKEPFVKIDLGSIHEQLFESELFGAKKGSYTGLNQDKIGRLAMADKGTLFLDEIGNLGLSMQSKLLSVLQNREIIRVGDTVAESLDARLVSATNLGMNELLDGSRFRQDLLYRINTVELYIPALRDRTEDIPLLMDYFVQQMIKKYGLNDISYSKECYRAAEIYPWPGNIRELEHAVERAVLLCDKSKITAADLIPRKNKQKENSRSFDDFNLDKMEKSMVEQALALHEGNMTKAAKALGITRTALYRRLEKHQL